MTMLVSFGVLGAVPLGLTQFHDLMHGWEVPMILFSGVVLAIGWVLHMINKKIDCNASSCEHEPCDPKRKRSVRILQIATALFVINVGVYVFVHMPQDQHHNETHAHHDEHDEHHH